MRASIFIASFFILCAPFFVFAQQGSLASVYGEALSQQAAQTGGLVTCSGLDCDFCKLAELVNTLITWLFGFMAVVAVLVAVYAGFKLVTSAGNVQAMSDAKGYLVNVILGFLLMLAAWLIIDTIMRGLTGQGMDVWGQFDVNKCGSMVEPQERRYAEYDPRYAEDGVYNTEGGEMSLDGAAYTGDNRCPNCVDMSGFMDCKNNCSTDREYAERLAGLARVVGTPLEVTEGYPPSRDHRARCHYTGTCVDIVFDDRVWTAERVRQFQAQASALGFRAVYEPGPGESCLGSSNCVEGVATGNHFSLYLK